MRFTILPDQLLGYSEKLKLQDDAYSQWASIHIVNELRYFLLQNPEVKHNDDFHMKDLFLPWEEKGYYLEYDGYWMLICKDEIELSELLHSWYNKFKL